MAGFKFNNKNYVGIISNNVIKLTLPKTMTIDDWAYFISWEDSGMTKTILGFNPNVMVFIDAFPNIIDCKQEINIHFKSIKFYKKRRTY